MRISQQPATTLNEIEEADLHSVSYQHHKIQKFTCVEHKIYYDLQTTAVNKMPTVINKNNKQSAANDSDVGGKAADNNNISKKVTKGKILVGS